MSADAVRSGNKATAQAEPSIFTAPTKPKLHFVNIIWGEQFTKLFLEASLPSQLSAGNLPRAARDSQAVYRIFTTARDADTIRSSTGFARLQAIVSVEIIAITIDPQEDRYKLLTKFHKHAIADAAEQGFSLVFLAPDQVVAEGAFANLVRLAASGKKAVMLLTIRLNKDSLLPELRRRLHSPAAAHTGLAAKDLITLAMDHLHPISRSLTWPPTTSWPSHLYWPVPGEGIIAHGYHLHPIMVTPSRGSADFECTIDDDYVLRTCSEDEIYVVEDAGEMLVFELSAPSHQSGKAVAPRSADSVARWASSHTQAFHRRMFNKSVRLAVGPTSPTWRAVAAEADEIIAEIDRLTKKHDRFGRAIRLIRPQVRRLKNWLLFPKHWAERKRGRAGSEPVS